MANKPINIPDKFLLTFEEASHYFGIGINKLYAMADDRPDWLIYNGQREMVKRVRLEKYLLESSAI